MGAMDDCVFHRRFFISRSGIMGLCPNNYQEEDIVVILLGCAVPVLLRPDEGCYKLVGVVYCTANRMAKKSMSWKRGNSSLKTLSCAKP
jgi:hypothetical protein